MQCGFCFLEIGIQYNLAFLLLFWLVVRFEKNTHFFCPIDTEDLFHIKLRSTVDRDLSLKLN